jgi:hypothetical protein
MRTVVNGCNEMEGELLSVIYSEHFAVKIVET